MKSQYANGTNGARSCNRAFAYARVSSKEQQQEGYSIEAQIKLLHSYAEEQGIKITREFIDVETAKERGRLNFGLMVKALAKLPAEERIVLVEKTDRLYRNIHDWVKLDDLNVLVHLVKDGYILSENSRSNEKFIHGIKVLMAKNYVDNLSEEVKKGLNEKASQGHWPMRVPIGYKVTGEKGRRRIIIDPVNGPLVKRLFAQYATGDYSIKRLRELAEEIGLRSCFGSVLSRAAIYMMLQNVLYTGRFSWHGEERKGSHEAIVSEELFYKVQALLKRAPRRQDRQSSPHIFLGLITCAHCGCALTAEMKKGKYVYYHCTGNRGPCEKPYVREEELERMFAEALGAIVIDDETAAFICDALREGHKGAAGDAAKQLSAHQERLARVRSRLSKAYDEKLDGKIDEVTWQQKQAEYTSEILELEMRIENARHAPKPYYEQAQRILKHARNLKLRFLTGNPTLKRGVLESLQSNFSYDGRNLHADWKKPYSLIAEFKGTSEMRGRRDSNSRSLA